MNSLTFNELSLVFSFLSHQKLSLLLMCNQSFYSFLKEYIQTRYQKESEMLQSIYPIIKTRDHPLLEKPFKDVWFGIKEKNVLSSLERFKYEIGWDNTDTSHVDVYEYNCMCKNCYSDKKENLKILSIFCCLCKNCAFPCFHYKCRYPPCEKNPSGIFTQEQYEFIGRYFQIWEEYTEVFYPGKTIHDYLKMLYET